MKKTVLLALGLTVWVTGCIQAGGEAKLLIGDHKLTVEIAATPGEQALGLMNRESLAHDRGMIFLFGTPKKLFSG